VILALSSVSFAQEHPFADATREITIKGRVVSFGWANPYCVMSVQTDDRELGIVNLQTWSAPRSLQALGWTRDSLKVGDAITIVASPNKGAPTLKPLGWVRSVTFSDGRTLSAIRKAS